MGEITEWMLKWVFFSLGHYPTDQPEDFSHQEDEQNEDGSCTVKDLTANFILISLYPLVESGRGQVDKLLPSNYSDQQFTRAQPHEEQRKGCHSGMH